MLAICVSLLLTSQSTAEESELLINEASTHWGAEVASDEVTEEADFSLSSCDSCCPSSSCGECVGACGSCCEPLLFGLFAPSDHCFDDFISPMTNPVYFEDPRTLTEARLFFLQHKLPPALGADDIQLLALQLRAALTDRLSIVAAKDGFITTSSFLLDDGWADVMIGLKYNLLKDPRQGRILSAGLAYELPVGSTRALQGNGDGLFHLYLSGGRRLGCNGHWLSSSGFLLPTDTAEESQVWYWSNHFDRRLGETNVYAFTEFNWYHWMRSGRVSNLGVEGLDLFNFGTRGVAGNDIVTGAFGFKVKPHKHTEIGVAWEFPLTDRRDVIDNRLTVDYILRY